MTQAGIGLLEAVKDMYGVVEGNTAGVEQKGEIGGRIIELVGFDKVKKEQRCQSGTWGWWGGGSVEMSSCHNYLHSGT